MARAHRINSDSEYYSDCDEFETAVNGVDDDAAGDDINDYADDIDADIDFYSSNIGFTAILEDSLKALKSYNLTSFDIKQINDYEISLLNTDAWKHLVVVRIFNVIKSISRGDVAIAGEAVMRAFYRAETANDRCIGEIAKIAKYIQFCKNEFYRAANGIKQVDGKNKDDFIALHTPHEHIDECGEITHDMVQYKRLGVAEVRAAQENGVEFGDKTLTQLLLEILEPEIGRAVLKYIEVGKKCNWLALAAEFNCSDKHIQKYVTESTYLAQEALEQKLSVSPKPLFIRAKAVKVKAVTEPIEIKAVDVKVDVEVDVEVVTAVDMPLFAAAGVEVITTAKSAKAAKAAKIHHKPTLVPLQLQLQLEPESPANTRHDQVAAVARSDNYYQSPARSRPETDYGGNIIAFSARNGRYGRSSRSSPPGMYASGTSIGRASPALASTASPFVVCFVVFICAVIKAVLGCSDHLRIMISIPNANVVPVFQADHCRYIDNFSTHGKPPCIAILPNTPNINSIIRV